MGSLLAAGGAILVLAGAFFLFAGRPALPLPSGTLGIEHQVLHPSFPDGAAATPTVELWYPSSGDAPWPVLVYLPSWTGTEIENLSTIRDLVSHGFAVVGLRYPTADEVADGRKSGAALRAELPGDMDFSSAEAYERTQQLGDERVRLRAQNVATVLDHLTQLDAEPGGKFAHRLDLEHIGVWGFSLGGAAAAQAAWLDRRIKVAANLDGWLFADASSDGLPCPYLLIGDAAPPPDPADLNSSNPKRRFPAIFDKRDYERQLAGLSRSGGFIVTIEGTDHLNFADAAARSRFGRWSGAGSIDPRRALAIIDTYLIGFFGTYLQGHPSPVLAEGAAPYPEAHLQVFGHGDVRS